MLNILVILSFTDIKKSWAKQLKEERQKNLAYSSRGTPS